MVERVSFKGRFRFIFTATAGEINRKAGEKVMVSSRLVPGTEWAAVDPFGLNVLACYRCVIACLGLVSCRPD